MTPTQRVQTWWPDVSLDPLGRPYLIAAVDVQQDWFRLIIRAWNTRSASRLVWADEVTTPGRIREITSALGVAPERVVLDRRHKPEYVRQIAAHYGWRTMFGEKDKDYLHPDGIRRVTSVHNYIDPFQGTIHQGRSTIVETNFAKWTCLSRLDILRKLQTPAGEKLFTAADDAPGWYFREMDAYVWIPKHIDGQQTGEWQVHGPDHAADCEVMGIAVASALGLTGAESLDTAATFVPTTPPP
jgi:hypothetical protein